jgi:hypothetical protein
MPRVTTTIGTCTLGLIALTISACRPASAYEDYVVDTSEIGGDSHGVVTSDQFLELGVPSANGLRMEGENALKMGKIDRAIMVLQRSVEMAPRDMDGRILYGEALEKKLLRQKERDPKLFNFVLKQWLFVAKNAEYADQGQQGYNHLYKLAGVVPKRFEKERKYLGHVLIPEDGSVKVTIGKHNGKGSQADTEPIAHKKRNNDEQL